MTKILTLTILLFGFQSKTELPTIEVNSVDKDILTYARVDCSNFHNSFEKKEIRKRTIKRQRQVSELIFELENLKVYDDRRKTDIRATLTIKYSDHVEKICLDKFSVYKNGTCYKITDRLMKTIW